MQDKYTVADLPLELELDKVEADKALGTIVSVIGWVVTIVGGLTLLFGPNTLRISYSGPTFFEFIQLYPGPIISVGLLIIMAGQFLSNQFVQQTLNAFQESIDKQLIVKDEDIPEGKELNITLIKHNEVTDLYRFELIDKAVSEEEAAPHQEEGAPSVSSTQPE